MAQAILQNKATLKSSDKRYRLECGAKKCFVSDVIKICIFDIQLIKNYKRLTSK